MIRIVKVGDRRIESFNARPAFPEEAEKAASAVLADIRKDGDAAVLKAVAKFEGFKAKRARDLMVDLESIRVDKGTVRVGKGAVGGNRPCLLQGMTTAMGFLMGTSCIGTGIWIRAAMMILMMMVFHSQRNLIKEQILLCLMVPSGLLGSLIVIR